MSPHRPVAWALLLAGSLVFAYAADTGLAAYRAMGVKNSDVLSGSVLSAQVLPEEEKQVVALVTYLTGKKDEADAVNVRLEVLRRLGDSLEGLYSRDYGKENGGHVGRGELEVVDLDGDGLSEIVVTYESFRDRLIQERRGEVILLEPSGFRVAWTGAVAYDATRAARDVPAERRDRYTREMDLAATLRTRGAGLVFTRKVLAVAGERLAEPRVSTEAFPLR